MTAHRRIAVTVGVLYLVTFATSIPALALKRSFLDENGSVAMLHGAAILEVILAVACVGTAIAFYPLGRTHSPALALGFTASRIIEAALVLFGVIALLSVGTLRSISTDGTAADTALMALHDWSFLMGPGLLPAANALLFGTLLLRARLVPRIIPIIGLIGAPLLTISAIGTVLGVNDQVSPLAGIAALPIALWEFSIGAWLIVKGFSSVEPAASQGVLRPVLEKET